jgi:chorismate mutase
MSEETEREKLRQRMVPGYVVANLPQYPVDDIKKGEKYAVPLPRWISGDTYEGQMYTIETATEDIKGKHEGVVFRPYVFTVAKTEEYIDTLRAIIDCIDSQLIELLNNRFQQAKLLAKAKQQKNLPIDDPERESEILNKIENRHLAFGENVKNIYKNIFNEMKDIENDN